MMAVKLVPSRLTPDGQHYLAAGAVDGDVMARPSDAVVPLGHEDVGAADAGQHAHRLVVGFRGRAARRVKAASRQICCQHHDVAGTVGFSGRIGVPTSTCVQVSDAPQQYMRSACCCVCRIKLAQARRGRT